MFRRIVGGCARTAGSALRIRSVAVRPAERFRREGARRAGRSLPCGGVSPGSRAPKRRQRARRCAGKFRAAGRTILRSVESSGLRQNSGFSASNPVRRGSSSGGASPGRNAPSQPELVPQRRFAGKPRAEAAAESTPGAEKFPRRGKTILRSVESSGAAPEQRVQRFESSQPRLVQRKKLAGKERAEPAGCPAAAFRRKAARRNSCRTTSSVL